MPINKFYLQDRKISHLILFVLESPGHGETHRGRLAKCLDNAASSKSEEAAWLPPQSAARARVSGSVFYGGSDRYGMGAGPDIMWCSGKDYNADMQLERTEGHTDGALSAKARWLVWVLPRYTNNTAKGDCRTWSPEAVAGWLPASPEVIKAGAEALAARICSDVAYET